MNLSSNRLADYVYNKASWALMICLAVDIVSQAAAAEICIAFLITLLGESSWTSNYYKADPF